MKKTSKAALAPLYLATFILLTGCNAPEESFEIGGYQFDVDSFQQWKLPKRLREISGLGATADGRLFAHGDEIATVHQLDYQDGKLVKSFSLGSSAEGDPLRGDFEGIALRENGLYLITSQGILYQSQIGGDGSIVPYQTFNTGASELCEVEGLAFHQQTDMLLIACKKLRAREFKGHVVVLQWSPQTRQLDEERTLTVSKKSVGGSFSPSGITISPRNGNLILVAAQQRKLLEVSLTGDVKNVFSLHMEGYHRQTEGIELLSQGTLILADEGGKKRGRLGTYRAGD